MLEIVLFSAFRFLSSNIHHHSFLFFSLYCCSWKLQKLYFPNSLPTRVWSDLHSDKENLFKIGKTEKKQKSMILLLKSVGICKGFCKHVDTCDYCSNSLWFLTQAAVETSCFPEVVVFSDFPLFKSFVCTWVLLKYLSLIVTIRGVYVVLTKALLVSSHEKCFGIHFDPPPMFQPIHSVSFAGFTLYIFLIMGVLLILYDLSSHYLTLYHLYLPLLYIVF